MKVLLLVETSDLEAKIERILAGRASPGRAAAGSSASLFVCDGIQAAEDELRRNRLAALIVESHIDGAADLCRRLRRAPDGYQTFVLAAISEPDPAKVRAAFEAGADDFLARPIRRADLRVKLAIAERTLAARLRRKELEQRVEHLEARQRTLMETLREGVFLTGGDGKIVFANRRLECMTGMARDELVGRDADALVEKKYRDRLPGKTILGVAAEPPDAADDASDDDGSIEDCAVALRSRGDKRWVKLRIATLPDTASPEAGAAGMLGVVQDVTEQREAEVSLRHREEYYRALLENSSDVISILDMGGRVLFQSETSLRVLGLAPEDFVGDDLPNALHPEDRAAFEQALEEVLAEAGALRSVEARFRHADGGHVYLESVLRNQMDNPVLAGVLVTSRDVTERRQAEIALKRERAFFQQLFRNSPAGIVILDNDDKVVDANRPFVDLFQFTPEEMAGRSLSDFIVPEELRQEASTLSGAVFERQSVEKETVRRRKDGTEVEVSILGYPIAMSDHRIGAYGIYTDISERKAAERKLFHHAFHDALTGLPNRSLFAERLERDLRRAQRGDYRFAVLFIDLDRFKVINDSLGHAAGDELLVEMGERLESCLRPGDTVARLGGDEFTILLEGIEDDTTVTQVAARVLASIGEPFEIHGQEVVTSGSIGIAYSSPAYGSADDLLRDADIAMYRAKAGGKARYAIFDAEMHRTAVERLRTENLLRQAVDRGDFELLYHPIVALSDGHVAGFEALVRWRHPDRGLLDAAQWLNLCVETGLMPAVGRWVLEHAIGQFADWRARLEAAAGLRLHINASAREIGQPEFAHDLLALCRKHEIDPKDLGLEISEALIVEDDDDLRSTVTQLNEHGLRLYLDDFGTGLSSLTSLHRFPIDAVKIDHTFVGKIDAAEENLGIVRAVTALAVSLGKSLVAEGVENRRQLELVKELGLEHAQGYFFARPLSAADAEALLVDGPSW